MPTYNSTYTSSSSQTIRFDVKSVQYIIVGGGGGGARPSAGYGRVAQSGAGSSTSFGAYAGGGQAGFLTYGGSGGYGNWRYGQSGSINYSNSEYQRASSGYGQYGYGGAGQWRSPAFTGGGGGGGASLNTYQRNQNGAIPNQSVSWTIGYGGVQGGTGNRRRGSAGAIYISQTTYSAPSVSISANPSSIIQGQTTTISWSASGDLTSVLVDGVSRGNSGSVNYQPSSTRQYTATASNPAYTRSSSVSVTVLIPPNVNLSLDNDTIILGQSTVLRWNTYGDASTLSITGGIGNTSLSSYVTVTPTTTTTYTATASGLGGTGSDSVTLTVLPAPNLEVTGPLSVNYGSDIEFSIEATNSEGGVSFTTQATNTDGSTENGAAITIPNSVGNTINITGYTYTPSYDNFGPLYITFNFSVDGFGGLTSTKSISVPITIDQIPNAIDIPSSDDKLIDEQPVITPDSEVTSNQLVIDDIDIPVEIKSDYPIQIEIDNSTIWNNVREI